MLLGITGLWWLKPLTLSLSLGLKFSLPTLSTIAHSGIMASDILRMMDYEDGVFVIWLIIQSDTPLHSSILTASLLHLSLVYCHFLASASLYISVVGTSK